MNESNTIIKPEISVYQNQLDYIAAAQTKQYYIYGPRGIGKSYFLHMLKDKLKDSRSEFIEGDNFKNINEKFLDNNFVSSIKLEEKQLFFDDFDLFLTRIYSNLNQPEAENIFAIVFSICNFLSDRNIPMIFTGRMSPQMVSELSLKYNDENARALLSLVVSKLMDQPIYLDPWKGNYVSYKKVIQDEIDKKLKNYHNISDYVKNMWKEEIINLTGGHPALLDPILKAFKKSAGDIEKLKSFEKKIFSKTEDDCGVELKQGIINFIEDTLYRGPINNIQRTLQDFITNTTNEYKEAIKYLFQLANKDYLPPPNNVHVRKLLKDAAIVAQKEEDGYFLIPGEIIKKEILRMCSSKIDDLQIQIKTLSPDSGTVEYFLEGIEQQVLFSSGSWEILSILNSKPNTIISLEEIKNNSHFREDKEDYALKSAIQRLGKKINSLITDKEFLENVRGEGYRLNLLGKLITENTKSKKNN